MNQTALDARCALAMARVVAPLYPERAAELEERAAQLATNVAFMLVRDATAPLLFGDEELLMCAFAEGQDEANAQDDFFEMNPPVVWSSRWHVSLDGRYETSGCVARSPGGYLPGLCVSHMGGDCAPGYREPVPTLDEAVAIAQVLVKEWHAADREPTSITGP